MDGGEGVGATGEQRPRPVQVQFRLDFRQLRFLLHLRMAASLIKVMTSVVLSIYTPSSVQPQFIDLAQIYQTSKRVSVKN